MVHVSTELSLEPVDGSTIAGALYAFLVLDADNDIIEPNEEGHTLMQRLVVYTEGGRLIFTLIYTFHASKK